MFDSGLRLSAILVFCVYLQFSMDSYVINYYLFYWNPAYMIWSTTFEDKQFSVFILTFFIRIPRNENFVGYHKIYFLRFADFIPNEIIITLSPWIHGEPQNGLQCKKLVPIRILKWFAVTIKYFMLYVIKLRLHTHKILFQDNH